MNIGVAGGSGSGKTTLARVLAAKLNCTLLSTDRFFRVNEGDKDFKRWGHDSPSALDFNALNCAVSKLTQNKTASVPIYNFYQSKIRGYENLSPTSTLLIEGLHVLTNAKLREKLDFIIFIEASTHLMFIRRLLRDRTQRGRRIDKSCQQFFTQVLPAYKRFILPGKSFAHHVVLNTWGASMEKLAVQTLQAIYAKAISSENCIAENPC